LGRSSIQTIIPLSDGSGLRLTTAKWFTPKRRSVQGTGLTPDIMVAPAADARTSDPQLDTAIMSLKSLIAP